MKKIYALLLIATGTFISVTAQPFEKGDKLLGGSIGYGIQRSTNAYPLNSTLQNTDYRYYSFSIAPSYGVFTKPNRLTGFSLLFRYGSSAPVNDTYKQQFYAYGASFFRQYWNSLGKNFYFNIQGRAGASYERALYTGVNQYNDTRSAIASIAVEPGFAYRMKRHLVLDLYYTGFLDAAYSYGENRSNSSLYSRSYGVRVSTGLQNFSLNNVIFGFRYVL